MKQFNPFSLSPGFGGAPMGRRSDNATNIQDLPRLHARHQGGRQGYDKGGVYWGTPSNVWGVWGRVDGEIFCAYVRAGSRKAAIEKVRQGDI